MGVTGRHGLYGLEANRVAPKLWVGSSPPLELAKEGFDLSVLCAVEDQTPRDIETFHVPLIDVEKKPDVEVLGMAFAAAVRINDARSAGQRVLVTCVAGVNRSAFVAALALVRGGWTPEGAIEKIRERRVPQVDMTPLCNRVFERLVYVIMGKRPPRIVGRA